MKIKHASFVAGYSSFYFDDQQAVKLGAKQVGFIYVGEPITTGYRAIRQAGECISILLQLEDSSIAAGDCTAVQYSGVGGRDPLFLAGQFIPFLERYLKPLLEGLDVDSFLPNSRFFDELEIEGQRLHTAIRYGLTQALLDATALSTRRMKAEVICAEYAIPVVAKAIPLFGQSGDDRYNAVDKMILKGIDVLPHGLINNVPDKLGYQGEKLIEYIQWLVARIKKIGSRADYSPILHIDVYGTIGQIFDQDTIKIASYLANLQESAGNLEIYIEGPIDAGGKEAQIEQMGLITSRLKFMGSPVKLVADEWCNTLTDVIDFTDAQCCHMVQIKTPDLGGIHNIVDAVLYCNERGMEAYQGGTCNETDLSAKTCVHLAVAAQPKRMLVKPGMGFDEGMNIVHNEMHRTIAMLNNWAGEK